MALSGTPISFSMHGGCGKGRANQANGWSRREAEYSASAWILMYSLLTGLPPSATEFHSSRLERSDLKGRPEIGFHRHYSIRQ